MNPIVKILMERDGLTEQEAKQRLRLAQNRVLGGEDPEEVLFDEFGIEPDYVFDLIDGMYEVVR
jgi:hypothetical protein